MAYQLTPEDFEFADNATQQKSIEDSLLGGLKSKARMYEQAGNIAEEYVNKPMRSITGGALQGLEHALASIGNLPLKAVNKVAGTDLKIPYIDLQDKMPQEPINRALFMGGEIAAQAAPGIGAFSKLSKLGKPSILMDALKGAGTGFATGGSENDDMLTRIISAALGGIVPSVSGLRNKKIAERVLEKKGALEKDFTQSYENVLRGKENVKIPSQYKLNIKELSDVMGTPEFKELNSGKNKKFLESYFDYLRNSNIKSAHKAQSELRKLSSKIEGEINLAKRQEKDIPDVTRKSLALAKSLRERVKGNISKTAEEKGLQDFQQSYDSLGKRYAEEMTPYFHPSIAKFEQGATRPTDLVKALSRDEKFSKPGGAYSQIPGLPAKRFYYETSAKDTIDNLLKGLLLAGGVGAAYQLGAPGLGRLLSNQ